MNHSLHIIKLKNTIIECELHQKRMQHAINKLQLFMPITNYQQLNDEQIEAIDQFLFRFTKLQDSIGQRLFSDILLLQEEPVKTMSFLDKLNRLEQLQIIASKEQWLNIRNICNKVAHEYEIDTQNITQSINHIYASYQELFEIFLRVKQYALMHIKG